MQYLKQWLWFPLLVAVMATSSHLAFADDVVLTPEVKNVHFVDSVGSNFLFRGERPVTGDGTGDGEFNIDGLKRAIAAAAGKAGVSLPSSYAIVDISLLWLADTVNPEQAAREQKLLLAEFAFFQSHPKAGQVHLWTSKGEGVSPLAPSLFAARDCLAGALDEWMADRLIWRTHKIRTWLENPSGLGMAGPIVIYVHCYGGCDRTGELIGAYAMRYQGVSWEDMNRLNKACCRTDAATGKTMFAEENCNALRWYALWLSGKLSGRFLNWSNPAKCGN